MAYVDFPDSDKGRKERKAFFLSDDGLTLIRSWRRQGIPLTKIAEEYIGVSRSAFWIWYRESDALRKTCATAMETTNATVEESLLKRATGYNYMEETYELVEGELIKVKEISKHVPPDVKAILAWLYNRLPNRWRSIQEPLESTQYVETVKNILVAMQEVANDTSGKTQKNVEADSSD